MAIRTINYSVSSDEISPKTEQRAGLQSEHAVTQLVFTLDNTLYQALLDEKQDGDTLVYRFDCIDSTGGTVRTDTAELTDSVITFTVGENLTRNGGKARVYLVISRYNAEEETEIEMLSFPARLRFENVPASDNGNSRESLSTLTEAAKNAAARAEQSADTAVEAQGKTELARLAIEGGSTVIFDGNGTFGEMDVDFVVDTELSKASDNAIANKAVAAKFESINNDISAMLSKIYPIGSIYISTVSESPSTLFGGTWVQIKDTFLLAAGSTYAAGATGGEATHTLTVNEMPSHSHYQKRYWGPSSDSDGQAYTAGAEFINPNVYGSQIDTTHSTGGNQPHNNMPPYLAVYVWKRTA